MPKTNVGSPAGAGTDTKDFQVTVADTTPGFASAKIIGGAGVNATVTNPGANETLVLKATGGFSSVRTIIASDNITTADGLVVINSGGGAVVATLPDAALNTDESFSIKATNITGGASVASAGGLIDGVAGHTFTSTNESITVVSDGTNWLRLA